VPLDCIVGIACLPIGVILFLNAFGATNFESLFGLSILLIAALALLAIQVTNIIDSHVQGHSLLLAYSIHTILLLPSIVYGLSFLLALPATVLAALPLIFACFITVEGLYSFFVFT
jgi:hypothetical protein